MWKLFHDSFDFSSEKMRAIFLLNYSSLVHIVLYEILQEFYSFSICFFIR